jgi:uncharacterized iron-regulated membrane protein
MAPTLRTSLGWLHRWAGVVLGGLLFAIFWTGTLSVFDREIDRWMAPVTRLAPPSAPASFGVLLSLDGFDASYRAAGAARAASWTVTLPTERQPVVRVAWRGAGGEAELWLDPNTGTRLADPETLAGTGFLYPFHYTLHMTAGRVGQWLVGLAALGMLALALSGVVIHRRLVADLFVFRTAAAVRRKLLDLHNIAGMLGLPFVVAITMSGLVISWPVYFPASLGMVYREGGRPAFNRDAFDLFDRPRLNRLPPAGLASLDTMAATARELWSGSPVRSLSVRHPGDAAAFIQIVRADEGRVAGTSDRVYFDAATGALLHRTGALSPVIAADRFLAGLHEIQFRHWTLRWLYFGLGLLGCVLIATGQLLWLKSRRRKHAQLEQSGVGMVERLTIGSVSGILIATLSFFVVNRLLPLGFSVAGQDRVALEIWTFYLAWLATFGHGWLRPHRGWIEQCWAMAALAVCAVLLNWLTTGDHLQRSLVHRHLWPIAGMDLLLLTGAVVSAAVAIRLQGRAAPSARRR